MSPINAGPDLNLSNLDHERPQAPDDLVILGSDPLNSYTQAWNCSTPDAIHAHLQQCWTPTSVYLNPFVEPVTGIDGLILLILDYHALFPNLTWTPTSISAHHRHACVRWTLTSSTRIRIKGTDFGRRLSGSDIIELNPRGQAIRAIGFLDGLAATPRLAASDTIASAPRPDRHGRPTDTS